MPTLTFDDLKSMISVRTKVSVDQLALETDLEDAGVESKDYADLLSELERKFGITIDSVDAADVATVGDLYQLATSRSR